MSGLIQKDICLLMQRKKALLIILFVGAMMGFSMDGSFTVGYITMLSAITTVSTISYDEFDNGYPFLMTLPITRKMYVQSKYIFSLICGVIGWCFAMLVYVAASLGKGEPIIAEDLVGSVSFIIVLCVILAVMLPLQLKYGAEGSRVVIAVIAGAVAVVLVIGKRFMPEGIDVSAFLENASLGAILGIFTVVAVAAMGISYLCSVKVMEHKTF